MKNKPGRPRGKPSVVIHVPIDRIEAVEQVTGKIITRQIPCIRIRVPKADVAKIRRIIKGKQNDDFSEIIGLSTLRQV